MLCNLSDFSIYFACYGSDFFHARSFDHDMLRCRRSLNRGRLSSLTCLRSKCFVVWLVFFHLEQLVEVGRPLRLRRQALAVAAALAESVIQTAVFARFEARGTLSVLGACLLSEELQGFVREHVIIAALAIVIDGRVFLYLSES